MIEYFDFWSAFYFFTSSFKNVLLNTSLPNILYVKLLLVFPALFTCWQTWTWWQRTGLSCSVYLGWAEVSLELHKWLTLSKSRNKGFRLSGLEGSVPPKDPGPCPSSLFPPSPCHPVNTSRQSPGRVRVCCGEQRAFGNQISVTLGRMSKVLGPGQGSGGLGFGGVGVGVGTVSLQARPLGGLLVT